jgi:putative ABC transport system ATP-binding protein
MICDEPTGALDGGTSELVISILKNLVEKHQATLLLVTHDEDLAASCHTVMRMSGGEIVDVIDAH